MMSTLGCGGGQELGAEVQSAEQHAAAKLRALCYRRLYLSHLQWTRDNVMDPRRGLATEQKHCFVLCRLT